MNRTYILISVLAAAALVSGCNLTGGIDNAKSHTEMVLDAQAKMDTGDCDGAVTILKNLSPLYDKDLQMLGSAYMCSAGATVKKVDAALGSYDPNSGNLTVVGTLANGLIPVAGDADGKIQAAINTFSQMSASNQRQTWITYGNIVRAAGLLAKASTDNAHVKRGDVSVSGCLNVSCSSGGITACTFRNLSDGDATALSQSLIAAANAASANTSLGDVQKLAAQLQAVYGGNTGAAVLANAGRCTAYNQLLSQ